VTNQVELTPNEQLIQEWKDKLPNANGSMQRDELLSSARTLKNLVHAYQEVLARTENQLTAKSIEWADQELALQTAQPDIRRGCPRNHDMPYVLQEAYVVRDDRGPQPVWWVFCSRGHHNLWASEVFS